ncbi:MAG: class I SAM-dependent methyltransferase [Pseudomonadota bacterium]
MKSSRDVNLEYYLKKSPGRADYWRKMAAPRFRMTVFLDLMKFTAPSALVDLGCGNGELLKEVRVEHPKTRLCGIDLSSMFIESNRHRDPSIDWHTLDLDRERNVPRHLAESFDIVMASEIIEHLEHPDIFLKNAKTLARIGGGMLFLSTQSGRVWETEKRVGHRRHFSAAEMEKLLSQAGWSPIRVWNAGFPFHDLSKWFANINPQMTMNAFSNRPYTLVQNIICMVLRLAYKFNSNKSGAQLFAIAERKQV